MRLGGTTETYTTGPTSIPGMVDAESHVTTTALIVTKRDGENREKNISRTRQEKRKGFKSHVTTGRITPTKTHDGLDKQRIHVQGVAHQTDMLGEDVNL